MRTIRLYSWNVNGIRAVHRKDGFAWFCEEKPASLCIQETKARPEQLAAELREPPGYRSYFSWAEKKGYSGVSTLTALDPISVKNGFGIPRFDNEGRIVITEYQDFFLLNIYFPNGKASPERLKYKMDFYDATLRHTEKLRETGKGIIVCGDVNTAHREIDLARPKENAHSSGFLPIEREWIDAFIELGFIDTFRMFNSEPGQYSWWDYKTRARERNIGWRIDYFFVSKDLRDRVTSAAIHNDIMGSDHCPISIDLSIDL